MLTPREGRLIHKLIMAPSTKIVNQFCLHWPLMPRQPMGRLGSPEEIAALAVYLASDAAHFVTGQAIVIDGGLTL